MAKESGSIGSQMAAATEAAVKNTPATFTLARNPFKLGKWNEYMSGAGKKTANVNVGVAYVALASNPAVTFPIDVRVIHAPESKPMLVATLPFVRFDGPMFRPSDHLSKADAEKTAAALKSFEKTVATEFHVWYQKLENAPPLTARPAAVAGTAGVTLDE